MFTLRSLTWGGWQTEGWIQGVWTAGADDGRVDPKPQTIFPGHHLLRARAVLRHQLTTTQEVAGLSRQRWHGVIQVKMDIIIIIININGGLAEVPTTGKNSVTFLFHLTNDMVGLPSEHLWTETISNRLLQLMDAGIVESKSMDDNNSVFLVQRICKTKEKFKVTIDFLRFFMIYNPTSSSKLNDKLLYIWTCM